MAARDSIASQPVSMVVHRKDYQPPTHQVEWIKLDFSLGVEKTRVASEFFFKRQGKERTLSLHGDGLALLGVFLDGKVLPSDRYEISPQALRIIDAPATGILRVETEIFPLANTELMGLYASRGGLFTQCESEGFRRITYFLDRPDVMTRYEVVMRGPRLEFPVMLSNGNLIAERDLGNGISEVHWQDPFPKPSYLFALVAAKLQHIEETIRTKSGKRALLQVYTRAQDLAEAGFALQSLKRAIFWDELRFGLELDLERFMIVAVPDFNSGAMENKGLNLFNTKYVLADPRTATDSDYDGIESVIAHEYFHNWTGNRITCRDWFQLTLKEGLTVFRDSEFSSDMAAEGLDAASAESARAVRRIESVRGLRAFQFPEDAGPMAHPIRPDSYQEIRNFYTATVYEKGAEVIRMLKTILGVDGFRRGMDLYFVRHDGEAVTCEEFVDAMFSANFDNRDKSYVDRHNGFSVLSKIDANQFMRWYDTSGTPHVQVHSQWNETTKTYELVFEQQISEKSPSREPLLIPIQLGLITPSGRELSMKNTKVSPGAELRGNCLVLKDWRAKLSVSVAEKPIPSLLRDFSAPIALDYDFSDSDLLILLANDTDSFNRWEAGQRLLLSAMLRPSEIDLEEVLYSFQKILANGNLSDAYKALMLTLPAESYVAEFVAEIDPDAIRLARDHLRLAVAKKLSKELRDIDAKRSANQKSSYSPDPISSGRRLLANFAQHHLALIGEIEPYELLLRFKSANNMTNRISALQVLVELGLEEGEEALALYAKEFESHALAMDKWFAVQSTLPLKESLDRVCTLLTHPLYDSTNPNRVRSVLGGFFHQNLPGFHRVDGKGYELWVEQVLAIDSRNSQLSARLARSLDRWARFEPKRRALIKRALENVATHPSLSADLKEVVSKALG